MREREVGTNIRPYAGISKKKLKNSEDFPRRYVRTYGPPEWSGVEWRWGLVSKASWRKGTISNGL